MWFAFFKMMFALLVVIVLLIITLKLTQKYSPINSNQKNMKLIEQLRLSPKSAISIVQIGETYLVLGTSDESVELIKELSEEEIKTLTETKLNKELVSVPAINFKTIKDQWRK